MLSSLPVALTVGAVLGFLAGLGIGGGSLLILWLTMVLSVDPAAARSINLLFFLPAAAVSCFFRWKQGCIQWRKILPATLAGCAAAAVFSWVGTRLELDFLKKCFGGLLIATGLRELWYRERN